MRYTDPTGHFADEILDVLFLTYDVAKIRQEGWTTENSVALAADLACAFLPIATGGGPAARLALAGGGTAANAAVRVPADVRALQLYLKATQQDGGQEDRMRQRLDDQGYQQVLGTSDDEMRAKLGATGEFADYIGKNPKTGKWLIAESKGGDVEKGTRQLRNAYNAVVEKGYGVKGNTSFRLAINKEQFQRLMTDPNGLSGWKVQEGYLGWVDESGWHDFLIDDIKVLVEMAE